ncbi:NAD(P)H-hydrate epimerase [Candidatus Nitrosotalea okcheonensis]|uniref:NAD(P)H-hydrate epimerase n=1 Tax=Candidatus Nitrosotalea okcheonensis TaxID=1903276 RepID=A0A2H1FI50_9ARCH|nr:NAD(P)H-hydrate epimerase [Candidatus Nitrosotalea okcheonensis]SMH72443.1 NAD(P)H-hydrate epimerase [Candidatus Nitrosotalea okcheonensis]
MEITVKQMMQIEENGHQMGFFRKLMMENAGAVTARHITERYHDLTSKKIIVFAGLGNNGGDAFVVARHLAAFGCTPTIILLGHPDKIKTEEARSNWKILEKMNSVNLILASAIDTITDGADVIVDGILGTGMSGKIREPYSSAIDLINQSNAFKFAVDVPSGLDPDTGIVNDKCVKVDITITFHKMKIGMPKNQDMCGKIIVEKIGIPPEAEIGVLL